MLEARLQLTDVATVPVSGLRWYDDPVALASDPAVDVVVELIGGSDGPARALAGQER